MKPSFKKFQKWTQTIYPVPPGWRIPIASMNEGVNTTTAARNFYVKENGAKIEPVDRLPKVARPRFALRIRHSEVFVVDRRSGNPSMAAGDACEVWLAVNVKPLSCDGKCRGVRCSELIMNGRDDRGGFRKPDERDLELSNQGLVYLIERCVKCERFETNVDAAKFLISLGAPEYVSLSAIGARK